MTFRFIKLLFFATALIWLLLFSHSRRRAHILHEATTLQIPVRNVHSSKEPPSLNPSSTISSSPSVSLTTPSVALTETPKSHEHSLPSRYAYVFYATNDLYACSVLVNVQRLRDFRTPHQIHVLASYDVSKAYLEAFRSASVSVSQHKPPPLPLESSAYYDGCLLKLLAFQMHTINPRLNRIIVLDADQLILQRLDPLFELPSVDIAAPRAYWIGKDAFASTLMVIEPSDRLWKIVNDGMAKMRSGDYDMDLVNQLFGGVVLMLPGSYVTLNSHWLDWNWPDWYRPDEAERGAGKAGAEKASGMLGLGEALSLMTETLYHGQQAFQRKVERFGKRQATTIGNKEDDWVGGSGKGAGLVMDPLGLAEDVSQGMSTIESHEGFVTSAIDAMEPEATQASYEMDPRNDEDKTIIEKHVASMHPVETVDKSTLVEPLIRLYNTSHVLHFTVMGKPWIISADVNWPDAHPLLQEQFQTWRKEASKVCPVSRLFK